MDMRTLRKALAKVSATLDEQSYQHGALVVDSPAGSVWAATGGHTLSVAFDNHHGHRWLKASIADTLERMAYGLQPCSDIDCDMCAEQARKDSTR